VPGAVAAMQFLSTVNRQSREVPALMLGVTVAGDRDRVGAGARRPGCACRSSGGDDGSDARRAYADVYRQRGARGKPAVDPAAAVSAMLLAPVTVPYDAVSGVRRVLV